MQAGYPNAELSVSRDKSIIDSIRRVAEAAGAQGEWPWDEKTLSMTRLKASAPRQVPRDRTELALHKANNDHHSSFIRSKS